MAHIIEEFAKRQCTEHKEVTVLDVVKKTLSDRFSYSSGWEDITTTSFVMLKQKWKRGYYFKLKDEYILFIGKETNHGVTFFVTEQMVVSATVAEMFFTFSSDSGRDKFESKHFDCLTAIKKQGCNSNFIIRNTPGGVSSNTVTTDSIFGSRWAGDKQSETFEVEGKMMDILFEMQ